MTAGPAPLTAETPALAPSVRRRPLSGIRIATVPADHVYVRHIDAEHPRSDAPSIVRLRDPDPDDPSRSAVSRWWPPAMLDPGWVEAHSGEFDVFHIQFGFDARTPAQLRQLVEALRRARRPLVYTVHDLRNPHHQDRAEHDAQLDVLIPSADALITLTPGAAGEIRRRWQREALVLPHPHVVDLERMSAPTVRRDGGGFRVGVHVKSIRAGMNPGPVIDTLVDAVRDIPRGVLQVNGHRDVLEPDGDRYDESLARVLRAAADAGDLELHVHDFLSDEALWDYLQSLDVSVLPYRFGTHSGWLEACRDLGTAVIAPDCGYFADQGPVLTYRHDESGLDAASLADAVRRAHLAGPVRPAPVEWRRAQRAQVADAHARLYLSLVG